MQKSIWLSVSSVKEDNSYMESLIERKIKGTMDDAFLHLRSLLGGLKTCNLILQMQSRAGNKYTTSNSNSKP